MRINLDDRPVPAVLGWAVAAGILAGHLVWAAAAYIEYRSVLCRPGFKCDLILALFPWEILLSLLVLSVGMFAVGLWDDLRGDERPRGFKGHLTALREAHWTGGLVKLVGGSLTALVGIWIFGGFNFVWEMVPVAACIALTANLINLFDRAPGRAGKVFLIVAIPATLLRAGTEVILSGAIGAMLAALPWDLRARAMLGDSGANLTGAFLGLALALGVIDRWGAVGVLLLTVVLLALNLASEKWSFSQIIARNPLLARLDHLGRE
ncbi:MAG: hypothetical protein M3277_08680 [Actinomycetota bacterium]|nr:hypothetical protein [Actinomycetota bacterium]